MTSIVSDALATTSRHPAGAAELKTARHFIDLFIDLEAGACARRLPNVRKMDAAIPDRGGYFDMTVAYSNVS